MTALNKAAGIALHLEGARHLRDEVGYFQAVQGNIQKYTVGGRASPTPSFTPRSGRS
jgi:hypothetical protein